MRWLYAGSWNVAQDYHHVKFVSIKERVFYILIESLLSCDRMGLPTLGAVDYVVLVLLLLSSAFIGVIFGFIKSKKISTEEYFLGT